MSVERFRLPNRIRIRGSWRAFLMSRRYRDYLIPIGMLAVLFGLIGWAFDLAWAWEIFGVIVMTIGAAILASAILHP
jgi:hypothetical protein